MTSLPASALPFGFRAAGVRRQLARRHDGTRPDQSVPPGRAVSKVARVTRAERGDHAVWRLDPHRYRPDAPHLCYLHGGAYTNGINVLHWRFLAALAHRGGMPVTVPDYPLAPASAAAATIDWSVVRYKELVSSNGPAERPVVLMGDSAGGGLVLSTAVAARDAGLPAAARLILLSPWLDVGMTAPEAAALDAADVMLTRAALVRAGQLYAGPAGVADPRVSPLFADLTGLPPASVYAGTADQLIADARRLAVRAAEIGWDVETHEAPDMIHDWMLFGFLPEARATMDSILRDIRESVRSAI